MLQEQKGALIRFKLNVPLSFTMCHQIRHSTQIHYARRGLEYTCFSRAALQVAFLSMNLAKQFLFYSKATLNCRDSIENGRSTQQAFQNRLLLWTRVKLCLSALVSTILLLIPCFLSLLLFFFTFNLLCILLKSAN